MVQVLREEKKYLIGMDTLLETSRRLERVLAHDPHNGTQGYMVRSLYFDTPFDDDLFQKRDGIETRRKIRLRCYGPGQPFAMLEMKQKQGACQRKRSLRVEQEDARRLAEGDFSPLLRYPEDFATEMYGLMCMKYYRPKAIVQYDRRAFIAKENRIRVTFDTRLEATESCFDLFSPQLSLNPVMAPCYGVLEVKYNEFLLEYIRRLLEGVDRSEVSVSKYVLARQHSYLTGMQ